MLESSQNVLLTDGVVHVHCRGKKLRVLDFVRILQPEAFHDLAKLIFQEIEALSGKIRRAKKRKSLT